MNHFKLFMTLANTTFKLPEDGVLTAKHAELISYKFTVIICVYFYVLLTVP